MSGLRTEFEFVLPKGFVDLDGRLHRRGRMRLATGRDELEPLRDQRINGADDPYLTVLVLARVITNLGSLEVITPEIVEGLFAVDLAFLQDLYGVANFGTEDEIRHLVERQAEAVAELEATAAKRSGGVVHEAVADG